ncbi:Glyoxylate/hydroxypyruvate reductase B [Planctomycetes bacterium Pan216]|uniref:Glyoxylate/hydroxypyruvate reductase B n=1 Tax=Kolteria novifilia TaxID=2527975 RepID=A0A518AX40_9BACT|nr:Glyoxylate/hydroxypyruvate reductase B [Planctomycetes bacterium Pan216]
MRVLLADYQWSDLDIENELLAKAGHELVVAPDQREETFKSLAATVDAIMTCWAQIPASVIDAVPDCKVVARLGIGLDNIDVAHCTAKKIPVTNVPTYCVEEVAEHALALLLSFARNVAFFDREAKQGIYSLSNGPSMRRIKGRVLGIVGFGRIGQSLAERALGIGMKVLVHTRSPYKGNLPVKGVPFDQLLATSDFVSIHAPLTEQTHHLFAAETLGKMKQGSFLINTSRGGLVDHAALLDAIESGHVGGAGLDVHDPEPPTMEEPHLKHPRVIVTPHAAFTSEESLADLRNTSTCQVIDALAGRRPLNVVNDVIYD